MASRSLGIALHGVGEIKGLSGKPDNFNGSKLSSSFIVAGISLYYLVVRIFTSAECRVDSLLISFSSTLVFRLSGYSQWEESMSKGI